MTHFHGDPTDSAAPMDLHGSTTDPVICYLAEHWLVDHLRVTKGEKTTVLVPTLVQVQAGLSELRAKRHKAERKVL